MKVIVNVLNSISIFTFTYGLFNKKEPLPMNKEQFSSWLVGFIDGKLRPSGQGGKLQSIFRQTLFKSNV